MISRCDCRGFAGRLGRGETSAGRASRRQGALAAEVAGTNVQYLAFAFLRLGRGGDAIGGKPLRTSLVRFIFGSVASIVGYRFRSSTSRPSWEGNVGAAVLEGPAQVSRDLRVIRYTKRFRSGSALAEDTARCGSARLPGSAALRPRRQGGRSSQSPIEATN